MPVDDPEVTGPWQWDGAVGAGPSRALGRPDRRAGDGGDRHRRRRSGRDLEPGRDRALRVAEAADGVGPAGLAPVAATPTIELDASPRWRWRRAAAGGRVSSSANAANGHAHAGPSDAERRLRRRPVRHRLRRSSRVTSPKAAEDSDAAARAAHGRRAPTRDRRAITRRHAVLRQRRHDPLGEPDQLRAARHRTRGAARPERPRLHPPRRPGARVRRVPRRSRGLGDHVRTEFRITRSARRACVGSRRTRRTSSTIPTSATSSRTSATSPTAGTPRSSSNGSRCTTRSPGSRTGLCSSTGSSSCSPAAAPPPSSTSTSTTSATSTTHSATPPATSSCGSIGARFADAVVGSPATLARVGGDEFVLLCDDVGDATTAVLLRRAAP